MGRVKSGDGAASLPVITPALMVMAALPCARAATGMATVMTRSAAVQVSFMSHKVQSGSRLAQTPNLRARLLIATVAAS